MIILLFIEISPKGAEEKLFVCAYSKGTNAGEREGVGGAKRSV